MESIANAIHKTEKKNPRLIYLFLVSICLFTGYGMFGIFIGVTTFAWVRWVFTQKKIVR